MIGVTRVGGAVRCVHGHDYQSQSDGSIDRSEARTTRGTTGTPVKVSLLQRFQKWSGANEREARPTLQRFTHQSNETPSWFCEEEEDDDDSIHGVDRL